MPYERNDLGTVLSLSGAAVLNTYVYSPGSNLPRILVSQPIAIWLTLTTKAASAIGTYTVTIEGRRDTSNASAWTALQSRNQQTDGAHVTAKEHAFTIAADTTLYRLVTCEEARGVAEVRVGVKGDAAGSGADAVVVQVTVR